MIILKSKRELALMRKAGRVVAAALAAVEAAVAPGVKTVQLDRVAAAEIARLGAQPAFLGYHGFPASICTSVNDEVVHGVPGERVLEEGDIISIDIGAYLAGFYGDAAVTLPVGEVGPGAQHLIGVTRIALARGIAAAVPGNRLSDIGHAVQAYVEAEGCAVVREYVGHGIGRQMHEPLQVPNFGPAGQGALLKAGLTLAIEPMVNLGGAPVTVDPVDGWTVRTADGTLSAHFEHTIAVTDDGPEVLTRAD
ncbi:MAG: type I methionyl aminopeptidase [Bacillota bacterium]